MNRSTVMKRIGIVGIAAVALAVVAFQLNGGAGHHRGGEVEDLGRDLQAAIAGVIATDVAQRGPGATSTVMMSRGTAASR